MGADWLGSSSDNPKSRLLEDLRFVENETASPEKEPRVLIRQPLAGRLLTAFLLPPLLDLCLLGRRRLCSIVLLALRLGGLVGAACFGHW
jgi:hypothetical protein